MAKAPATLPWQRRVQRPSDTDRGSSAVEFALVLPVLLMVLFGIIDFGRLEYERITVTNAAFEAARSSGFKHDAGTISAAAQSAAGPLSVVVDTATSINMSCTTPDTMTVIALKRPAKFTFFTPVLRSVQLTVSAQGAYQCLG